MIKSGGTSALFYVFAQLTMQQFTEKEVRESYGQALDDEGGKLGAVSPPLLLGIALDELFVNRPADEGEGLLLEIFGFSDVLGFDLRPKARGSVLRSHDALPQPHKGIHIEGKVVALVPKTGDRAVDEVVELGKRIAAPPETILK